jgi:hypothetical protein
MQSPPSSTHQKALRINLDPLLYGSFAEIGAGQEVARWFFQVGGAAGTIARSTSAYDMAISDVAYGPSPRYVSRERLEAMLDTEFDVVTDTLSSARGEKSAFFAFADTVSARNYRGTNECHGWMGVQFQSAPNAPVSRIIIHVRMLDNQNVLQQDALGIVGVNLLYAAFYYRDKPHQFLESLLDNLSTDRIEIDMAEFSGHVFPNVDNRAVSLKLVQLDLTGAAMFAPDGTVLQPSSVLRKRPVLVERGSFRPPTKVNLDMLQCARRQFAADLETPEDQIVELAEINLKNLLTDGSLNLADFLARADLLAAAGKTVLVSDYFEYYRLAAYIARYTNEPIAVTLGASSLQELFNETYYQDLEGGILEAFGKLFTKNLRIYVYPYQNPETRQLQTAADPPKGLENLHAHLAQHGRIKPISDYDPQILHIFSRDVLKKIKAADPSWQSMVTPEIAQIILHRSLFT